MVDRAFSDSLAGLRVLDLGSALGNYCGKMFAELGADVILVEPPGGNGLRREGPYVGGVPQTEGGLAFAYANTSKRGVTADLDHPEGRRLVRTLAAKADLVIEAEPPGAMAARGLDRDSLAAANPALVYTSISAFGQTGPYAGYQADDLVAMALGGMLYLGGYKDDLPVAAYGQQAYASANLFAAVASLTAILAAETSGQGEAIDVSVQESVVMALENAVQFYELEGTVRARYGGDQRQAGAGLFPCRDGHIVLLAGGIAANRFWKRSLQWLEDEGVAGVDELKHPDWLNPKFLATAEAKAAFRRIFDPFALTKSKEELFQAGRARQIPLAPVATPEDILSSRQLRHRGFFTEVWNEVAGREITIPGAPYRLSATPWRLRRPAPRLGEHNGEVYGEIGIGPDELAILAATGVI